MVRVSIAVCSIHIRHSAAALLEREIRHDRGDHVSASHCLAISNASRLQVFGNESEFLHVYSSPIVLHEALALYVYLVSVGM